MSAPARILIPVKSALSSPRTAPRTTPRKSIRNAAPGSVPLSIPLLDLRRQYEGIREDVLAAIARVCDSQGFILGPEVEALEREIAGLTGATGAVGCASGTEALWLALVATYTCVFHAWWRAYVSRGPGQRTLLAVMLRLTLPT